jgi:predicted aspartyl protease
MIFTFAPKDGPIFLEGEITGPIRSYAVRLILDTGATTTLINQDVLTAVGFDLMASDSPADRMEMATGSTIERVSKIVLTRLSALGQHRFGFSVVSHSLPAGVHIDGLLGLDFFRNQVLTVDFQKGRIALA